MIPRFICWLWGHDILRKAMTPDKYTYTNIFGRLCEGNLYVWEQQPFCIRCSKPNEHYEGIRKSATPIRPE